MAYFIECSHCHEFLKEEGDISRPYNEYRVYHNEANPKIEHGELQILRCLSCNNYFGEFTMDYCRKEDITETEYA